MVKYLLTTSLFLIIPTCFASPQISPEQAIASVVNSFEVNSDSIDIKHPAHTAKFSKDGMQITPRKGGPVWRWELDSIANSKGKRIQHLEVAPELDKGTVKYNRGALTEQYVARENAIEQQFEITSRLK